MVGTSCEGQHPLPRKVLIVTASLSSGGAENVVTTIASHWARAGREVTIAIFDPGRMYYPVDPRVSVLTLGQEATRDRTDPLRVGRRALMLRRAVARVKPDLVVSFLNKVNVLTYLATRGSGIPVVLSERNNPGMDRNHWLWRHLGRFCYRRAQAVVLPTRAIRQELPEIADDRLRVIANPLSPLLSDRLAAPLEMPHGPTTFVSVGRLVAQKRFDVLIDAFARIADELPDWRLTIFGHGPLREALEAQRDRLGLAGRIALPGVTERPVGWVRTGSVFVMSSSYEGFGNVLVEASAAGQAVISTDCPFGPAEIIEHGVNGLLCPPEDPAALAEAMARVATDEDLRRRLGRAALRASERYSVSEVAAQWDALLADLAARPGGAAGPAGGETTA